MKALQFIQKKTRYIALVLLLAAFTAVVSGACNGPGGIAKHVSYKGGSYFICGGGERIILKGCGLPEDITEDLAGTFVSHLEPGPHNSLQLTEFENDTGMKMFEYGPEPNENVYIVLIDRRYYAAILHDAEGYHGLQGRIFRSTSN